MNEAATDARRKWERERSDVPAVLRKLAQRELEVATVVFSRGEATASEVVDALNVPISNSAVRSMLGRLEAKGILTKRVYQGKFVYRRAGGDVEFLEKMLEQFAGEYFGGSLVNMANHLSALINRVHPDLTTHMIDK